MKRLLAGLVAVTTILGGTVSPSTAITFGKEVTNASDSYPSVVSIWYADNATEDASFMCTGTLIQPKIVLTAAHCVLSSGLYFVQYGADQLFDEMDLLEVSATWRNPRYSASQMVNDTGLLLLKDAIPGAVTTRLPSSAEIKSIQANKAVKYEIVGWGKDQNDEPATYLRKAAVDDQTAYMKKLKGWRNDVWFAVGKWNNKEKVFAGSCNGDSGGPLFATVGTKKILAGITSWGAEDCETAYPSTYVRLSYYIDTINNIGIPTLLVNESKQNRALPSVITEPRIVGTVKAGNTLNCNQGVWSSNTTNISVKWMQDFYNISTSSALLLPSNSLSTKKYTCEITGTNSNGSVIRKIDVVLSAAPFTRNAPYLNNMPTNSTFTGNTTVTCTPGTFDNAISVTNEWWVGDSSYSDPTQRIASGNTFTITTALAQQYSGK